MKEIKKDLFDCISEEDVDAICITTNGHVTDSGSGIMGGGCAGVCSRRWPETEKNLGSMLSKIGKNIPFIIGALDNDSKYIEPTLNNIREHKYNCLIFSFPTIDNLMDGSKISLIETSATIMVYYANALKLRKIVLGRPGVGIGGLQWQDVKKAIEPILDDRFIIVSFPHEE